MLIRLVRTIAALALGVASLSFIACGKTPTPTTDGPAETITGNERIGWMQTASDPTELATLRYAMYVDGVRSALFGATCDTSASTQPFACTAPLPRLTQGQHVLEIASFVEAATLLESTRSSPLRVTVTGTTIQISEPTAPGRDDSSTASNDERADRVVLTHDGVGLRLQKISRGVVNPADLAVLPDSRILVAQQDGRIHVVQDGRLLFAPALTISSWGDGGEQIVALTVDQDFSQTHFVYAVYTGRSRSGGHGFVLARFRETNGTLIERIILKDDASARAQGAAAALRFGPDHKLFAAFDDGGNEQLAADLAAPNGKVLRLNPDGTTPDDQAGFTPLFSYPYRTPRGLAWNSAGSALWIADRDSTGTGRIHIVTQEVGPRKRGTVRGSFRLPRETVPSSVAFYGAARIEAMRGDLLIASEEGRHILRVRLDPSDPAHVLSTERLLDDQIGGIRSVTTGADGTIYIGTADTIWKLVPLDRQ